MEKEVVFVDTYFKIKMKTQQLGLWFQVFACSQASLFGLYTFRLRFESFDSLPFLGGWEHPTPNTQTCIPPDSQTVLHHTPHFEILRPSQLGHMTFGNLKLTNDARPTLPTSTAQPSDSQCQPYLRQKWCPHGTMVPS